MYATLIVSKPPNVTARYSVVPTRSEVGEMAAELLIEYLDPFTDKMWPFARAYLSAEQLERLHLEITATLHALDAHRVAQEAGR